MNSAKTFWLLLVALFVVCFSLAANLATQFQALENRRHQSDNFFNLLLGDSSRIFANSSYVEADAYYHSGYYPTIFDNNEAFKTPHMAEDSGTVAGQNKNEEALESTFMGPPRNWIDAFGRHFIPNRHTHLDEGGPTGDLSTSHKVEEILPWLKLSAELDPDNVQTYTVTAYWLRRLHKDGEANQVLFEGLRNNPDSYEILYELGRLYDESYHDTNRAQNVWEAAARKFLALPQDDQEDNKLIFERIATHLAELEENSGNLPEALKWFRAAQTASETPGDIQLQIEEVQKKMAAQPSAAPVNSVR